MTENAGKENVGSPVIKGAKVTAKVLEHLKDDKVIVFKKKRRKGYKVKNGHRQYLTKLEVLNIDDKATVAKKTSAKEEVKPIAKKASVKKDATKKPAAKKVSVKKDAAKKSPPKKAPAKKKPKAKKAE